MMITSRWPQLAGRVALGTIFVVSAMGKIASWRGTVGMAGSKGVPEVLLAVATALELLGGLSIVSGYKVRWGAIALIVFLVPVTLVFHNFWALQGNEQRMQMIQFLKNLAIGGGLLVVYAVGAGAVSIDAWRARRRGTLSAGVLRHQNA